MFLQDDVKVTRRLTVNLGIRWDYQPLPVEQYNRLSNWNPNLIDPSTGLLGALEFASPDRRTFAPNHYRDFSPRFGFAWDVLGTGKTVLRAGGGLIYEMPSIRTFMYNGGGLNLNPTNVPGVTPGGPVGHA